MRAFEEELENLFTAIQKLYEDLREDGKDAENLKEDDIVTEVDLRVTELVREFFEELEGGFRIESEELNKKDTEAEAEADYTVLLDEIDGTGNMKNYSGSFGPIIGIAEGTDPKFQDVVAAGFMDLMRGISYTAYRGKGSYRTIQATGETQKIRADKTEGLGEQGDLLIDQPMLGKRPDIAREAWKHWCRDYNCAGHELAMVAEGSFDAFITGSEGHIKNKKTGEEIGPLFLLINEANGVITDWNGMKIDDRSIGLEDGKGHNIIAAQNMEIADEISEDIL